MGTAGALAQAAFFHRAYFRYFVCKADISPEGATGSLVSKIEMAYPLEYKWQFVCFGKN